MLVEMTLQIQGARDGLPWPPPGQCLDVGDLEAVDLFAAGYAKEAAADATAWDPDAGAVEDAEPAEDSDDGTSDEPDGEPAEDSGTVAGDDAVRPAKPRKATAKRK